MKKIISVLAAVCILLSAIPFGVISFAEDDGTDPAITWNYDEETKTLTVEGTGAMEDYASLSDRPWNELEPENIVVGEGITSIGNSSFSSIQTVKSIQLPSGLEKIGDEAFYLCTAVERVEFPDSIKVIGKSSFSQCTAITEITLPETLQEIDERAFYCCEGLENISAVGATKLGANIFDGCEKLAEIEFSEGVTEIPEAICTGCTALSSVKLPESLRKIGAYAFDLCPSLNSITVPALVSEIGEKAFGYGKRGDKIEGFTVSAYTGTPAVDYAAENGFAVNDLGTLNYGLCGENAVWSYDAETKALTVSGTGATHDYTESELPLFSEYEIEKIVIGKEITSIGAYMFFGCGVGLFLDLNDCDSLTSIGEKAFYNCDNLAMVRVGAAVENIGDKAFAYSFYDGTEYVFSDVILVGKADSALQSYAEENEIVFISYEDFPGFEGSCGENSKWEYDPYTGALKITGSGAVEACTDVTGFYPYSYYTVLSVDIAYGITDIGDYALFNCYIDSVNVPESVEHIGECALGYIAYYNEEDGLTYAAKIPDFVIISSPFSTCVPEYAEENEFDVQYTSWYTFNDEKPMIVNRKDELITLYAQDVTAEMFKQEYFVNLSPKLDVSLPDVIRTGTSMDLSDGMDAKMYSFIVMGDINGDGTVNSIDALLALSHSVGNSNLTGMAYAAADLNGDSVIDSFDALAMLGVSVGKVSLEEFMPQSEAK